MVPKKFLSCSKIARHAKSKVQGFVLKQEMLVGAC